MAKNKWVTGAPQDGSSVAPRPPMEPRGPTATSGGIILGGHVLLQGILACGHIWMFPKIGVFPPKSSH